MMEQMKVLQIGLGFNPGGMESFIMTYYRELRKCGVQFDFIAMFPHIAYEEEIQALGGKIYHTSDARKHPVAFYREMRNILKAETYDVVHANMLSAANIVPLIAAKRGAVRKIIAHSHNSSTPGIVRNILHRINKPLIPHFATDLFACSAKAGKWMYSDKMMKTERFHIIPNALDMKKFLYDETGREQVRAELGLKDRLVIGHVGRFEEQKNHEFLIEVFREIAAAREDAVLLLIGEGELQDGIRRKVKDYGLTDKVRFLGVRSDVPRLWKAMDIFILPSLFEGLPIVALEAQASGVCSILADTITREVQLTDNVSFLSLNDSPEKWCEEVLSHIGYVRNQAVNEKILADFRKAGYDIETAAQALLSYYKQ